MTILTWRARNYLLVSTSRPGNVEARVTTSSFGRASETPNVRKWRFPSKKKRAAEGFAAPVVSGQMQSTPSQKAQAEQERVGREHVPALTGEAAPSRRGVHFFAVTDGEGRKRQLTFGISLPLIAEAYRAAAAVLFCVAALIPSFLWAVRDRHVWPWDQAWYGEVSVDLWYFFTHAPAQWLQLMTVAFGMKPPGSAWLGQFFVPFRGAFGSVETALLFSILLTQLAVLVLVYRISVELAPHTRGIGFLGVGIAAGAEQFVGLSHQYLVEPLQCLAVAWTVLIALRSHEWPRARTLIHLVGSTLLGMLAKASTPVYALIPIAFILLNLAQDRKPWDFKGEWRLRASRSLVYGCVAVGALGSLWYARNYAAVLQHVRDASSGEIALNYGFRAPVAQKYIIWLRFLKQAFFDPYLVWMLAFLLLAAGGAILIARVRFSQWRRWFFIGTFSVAQIAVVLFGFALNDALETRYLYALLPYVTIILVVLCAAARYRALQTVAAVACFAQWAAVNQASFELLPVLANQSPWLNPIGTDATAHRELSDAVRRTSIFPGYNIIAVEEPWLNANSAAFFAAKNRLDTGIRSYYTSLGYAEKDPAVAMKRIEDFATRFVITLDEPAQSTPNFLNLVTLPVLHELESGGRFTRVPFSSEKGMVIFERQNRASVQP
jgi:hypothetical protein